MMNIECRMSNAEVGFFKLTFLLFLFFAQIVQSQQEDVFPGLVTELLYTYNELPGVTKSPYLSPTALAVSSDSSTLYAALQTGRQVAFVDLASNTVTRNVVLGKEPTGLAVSPDNTLLYVTCFSSRRPGGEVAVISTASGTVTRTIPAGHSPRAPVISPDGTKLYVCNQFKDYITVLDAVSGSALDTVAVIREPYAAGITPDGANLVVANYLPLGRTDVDTLMASVSIINTADRTVAAHVELTNGAQSLAGLSISPDGKYAYVTHVRSLFTTSPLTEIKFGWINANALSVVDIPGRKFVNVVLLDDMGAGAANPWGVAAAGSHICVAHAGSHELSIINGTAMHTALATPVKDQHLSLSYSLAFTNRKSLTVKGPRAIAIARGNAYVAGYFSDNIEIVNLATRMATETIALGPQQAMSNERRGQFLFSDATICLQKWQTCVSCHPFGRTDGLNWDLENDGNGNSKNDKSLLFAHLTPPAMISGIREDAEYAVMSGIRFILFTEPKAEDTLAISTYLRSLRPVPGPHLVDGQMSAAAKRGKNAFLKAKCDQCHPSPLYTDMQYHDVGTRRPIDQTGLWDTPTLIENWRTAPYIHDGMYVNMKEVYTVEKHYMLSVFGLTANEINDLTEYVNSL
jgi:YVTN family beta-propeller protein